MTARTRDVKPKPFRNGYDALWTRDNVQPQNRLKQMARSPNMPKT